MNTINLIASLTWATFPKFEPDIRRAKTLKRVTQALLEDRKEGVEVTDTNKMLAAVVTELSEKLLELLHEKKKAIKRSNKRESGFVENQKRRLRI